jgi:hypothetical protein
MSSPKKDDSHTLGQHLRDPAELQDQDILAEDGKQERPG